MKINSIELYNFGSYEEKTIFETNTNQEKNIIVFGGKNGAGKTTLFTAVTLCLYGCLSMGYKNNNSFYNRKIKKLINDNAKQEKNATAYTEVKLSIPQGAYNIEYILHREWLLEDSIIEKFIVYKEGILLSEEEVSDFEKYIKSIIPPELFNLYFFDGEKIADFFLEEKNDKRTKNAFLTLCGYDTFEIMRKNFKRLSNNSKQNDSLDNYLKAKEERDAKLEIIREVEDIIMQLSNQIKDCDAELAQIEKEFELAGGKSETEINRLAYEIKTEENKRALWNQELKKLANDTIPFLMIKSLLNNVSEQIENERKRQLSDALKSFFSEEELINIFKNRADNDADKIVKDINDYISRKFDCSQTGILDLSFDQIVNVKSQIEYYNKFDISHIYDIKKSIKDSINRAAYIRNEIEHSNVNLAKDYLSKKETLINEKMQAFESVKVKELEKFEIEKEMLLINQNYDKAKAKLEQELKNESISDISAKAILMLDELQETLYHKEIKKVENNFKKVINTLMYKMNFIDDIHIDDDFNVHLYRYDLVSADEILDIAKGRTLDDIKQLWGSAAVDMLEKIAGSNKLIDILHALKTEKRMMMLPKELNKENFSNGEKQIYIMALYYSIMMINSTEMPFIIDTPFARIDMEHRNNISKHFFSKLNGQVFILSTDEEINDNHMQLLKDKVATTYLLENKDNKKTVVTTNKYFEV